MLWENRWICILPGLPDTHNSILTLPLGIYVTFDSTDFIYYLGIAIRKVRLHFNKVIVTR